MSSPRPPVLRATTPAVDRLLELAADGLTPRLDVSGKGCAGKSYVMERVSEPARFDEAVTLERNAVLLVSARALPFVLGTTVDWVTDGFSAGFRFDNPNEATRCGCGTSFST